MRAAFLILLLAAPTLLVNAAAPPPPCEGFQDVPGQGPSCPIPGGWRVYFDDGSWGDTHGPDPAAFLPPDPTDTFSLDPPRVPPVCVPTTEARSEVIYAYPGDSAARSDAVAFTQATVEKANARLHSDSASIGTATRYRFKCDAEGHPSVAVVRLGFPEAGASFTRIVNALRPKYQDPLVKYWVYYDAPHPLNTPVSKLCGQGTIVNDDSPSALNGNNYGNVFGVTYQCDWLAMMHENGHNMGAVQHSAAHSSGGWHCNDGYDIMCYSDGGSRSSYSTGACPLPQPFDCRHDDYFHPAPPPGSYLDTHWNIGAAYNRYLSFNTACTAVASDTGTWRETTFEVSVPSQCQGHFYSLTSSRFVGVSVGAVVKSGFDVCWYAGAALLRCDQDFGDEHGTVPVGTTRAVITLQPGSYLLATYELVLG